MENIDFTPYRKTIPSVYRNVPVDLLCEMVGINTEWQIKNIQEDLILQNYVTKEANFAAFGDNRARTHLTKEGFITWVLGLDYKFLDPDRQPVFIQYKQNLLKYFFHNTIEREELMREKVLKEKRIQELEEALKENDNYLELMELKAGIARIGKKMIGYDRDVSSQLSLFSSTEQEGKV